MLTDDERLAIIRDAGVGSVMLLDTVERILAARLTDRDAALARVEALADDLKADVCRAPLTGRGQMLDMFERRLRAALRPDPSEPVDDR